MSIVKLEPPTLPPITLGSFRVKVLPTAYLNPPVWIATLVTLPEGPTVIVALVPVPIPEV